MCNLLKILLSKRVKGLDRAGRQKDRLVLTEVLIIDTLDVNLQ